MYKYVVVLVALMAVVVLLVLQKHAKLLTYVSCLLLMKVMAAPPRNGADAQHIVFARSSLTLYLYFMYMQVSDAPSYRPFHTFGLLII